MKTYLVPQTQSMLELSSFEYVQNQGSIPEGFGLASCAVPTPSPCLNQSGVFLDMPVGFCVTGVTSPDQMNGTRIVLHCDNEGTHDLFLTDCEEGGPFTCEPGSLKVSCVDDNASCDSLNEECPNNNLSGLSVIFHDQEFGCDSFQEF
jgi:hypothetical protein